MKRPGKVVQFPTAVKPEGYGVAHDYDTESLALLNDQTLVREYEAQMMLVTRLRGSLAQMAENCERAREAVAVEEDKAVLLECAMRGRGLLEPEGG